MVGKVLGAMIGGALGVLLAWSPVLAISLGMAGVFLGHLVLDREQPLRRPPRRETGTPREAADFIDALCPLFMSVARADGPVIQAEIKVIRHFFEQRNSPSKVRVKLKVALRAAPDDVDVLAKRAREVLKPSLRIDVVRALYELSVVDGDIHKSEHEQIRRIVSVFNVSDEQLQTITAKYFGSGADAYRTLGLDTQATNDEVKSAFRMLAVEYHPDRTPDGGQRFREVKEAYETIRKLRAF